MTMTVVFIQRCLIILAIFLCYSYGKSHSLSDKDKYMCCEMFPYHPDCRGVMLRKRSMISNLYGIDCNDNRGNLNCIQELQDRLFSYIPLSKSRILITLFDKDMQKDVMHRAQHGQRSNEVDARRIPLMDSYLSEVEPSDNNY